MKVRVPITETSYGSVDVDIDLSPDDPNFEDTLFELVEEAYFDGDACWGGGDWEACTEEWEKVED